MTPTTLLLSTTIGIVIAMDKEFNQVAALLNDTTEEVHYGRRYVKGSINDKTIVLTQCGIGKVNAAIGTTELINIFRPGIVISTGVAGGASTNIDVMDVVVSNEVCYHDVYCGTENEMGQVQGLAARFTSDIDLLEKIKTIDCGTKIHPGLIVTGDWFVDSPQKMSEILAYFPEAMAVDMESAAIAHTCWQHGVKFISFRIISDIPLKENNTAQYNNFWDTLGESSFNVTKALLDVL